MTHISAHHLFFRILSACFLGLIISSFSASVTLAQTETGVKNKSPFPVKYTSEVDRKALIKTIVLAPVYDNVNGIYFKPIQKLLMDLLQNDKVWGYAAYPDQDKNYFIEQYDSDPAAVLQVLEKAGAQGLITAFITKGANGLTARLKLFTQDQGYLLIEESFQDSGAFEISRLREKFNEMYRDIKNKLPYRGYVLSRRGQDVTLNLGSMNGVKVGQELSLAQIIKINRHPKLRFMVGVEKEVIAKVQVTKVEEYLSFAKIIFEKETGVVETGAKVLPSDFISYPLPKITPEGDVTGDIPEKDIKPRETPPPQTAINTDTESEYSPVSSQQKLGVITAQGVLSTVKESTELRTGSNYELSKSWTPGFYLGAQLYYIEGLFIDFNMQYTSFSAKNPLTPTASDITYNYTRLTGALGYDYPLTETNVTLTGAVGFSSYRTDVSDSTPTALTDSNIDAASLQLKAALALEPVTLGIKMDFAFAKSFSESPVNSGSASTSVTNLGVFGLYPFNTNINGRVDLAMNKINTDFSGTATRSNPANSSTIELVNLQAGIEYMF